MNKTQLISSVIEELITSAVNAELDKRLGAIENRLDEFIKLLKESQAGNILLNKREACKFLSISYPTLRSLEKKGLVKPVLSDSKTIRFSKRQLTEFLNVQK